MAKKESKESVKASIPFFTKPFKEKSNGKNHLRKKDSIFKRQEQKEEEIITGSLKNKLFKPKKQKEKVVITPPKNWKKKDYILLITAAAVLMLIFFLLVALLYSYLNRPQERYLETGDNVETALVREELTAEIVLKEFNPANISKIKLIFLGDAEYYYETADIRRDYVFSASDAGISSFKPIVKVSAVFRYNLPVPPVKWPITPNQTKAPSCTDKIKNGDETGVDCGGSCRACSLPGGGSGGDGSGGGDTACTARTCTDYAGMCGSFSNSCGGTLNCGCGSGFYCYIGEGVSSVCINNSFSCADSDGKNYYIRGNVTVNNYHTIVFKEDACYGILTEFFCYFNGSAFEARNESYQCPYRCLSSGGACEKLSCGQDANCTSLNIPKVESCTYNPDGNPFTWDYRAGSASKCANNECTYGDPAVLSKCIKGNCSAECNTGETFNSSDFYCSNNNLYNYLYECNSTCGFSNLSSANDGLIDSCARTCKTSGCNLAAKKYLLYNASSDSCRNNSCVEPVFCNEPISSACEKDCGASCEEGTCSGVQVCDPGTCTCMDRQCTRHSDCLTGYCNSAGICQNKLPEGADCLGIVNPVYPGQSNDSVCLGYCSSDYDGGKFCTAVSSSCTHDAATYAEGALAPDCLSITNERKCLAGAWASGTTCEDADKCNGISECREGACKPGAVPVCDDGNKCNGMETCNPLLGCVSGTVPNCNDLVECTEDSCHPTLGCQNIINDSKCDSTDWCTVAGCVVKPVCGNSVIEIREVCDQAQLGGKNCSDFFTHGSGTLKCCSSLNCTKFDFSACLNITYTSCSDSDGGINFLQRGSTNADYTRVNGADCQDFVPGGIESGSENFRDACSDTNRYLTEFYCDTDDSLHNVTYDCGSGGTTCLHGRCTVNLPSLSIWERIKQFFGLD